MPANAKRTVFRSDAPWEPQVGYSRAVRSGDFIAVSGSAAVGDDGKVLGRGDMYRQAQRCIEVIGAALASAGASLSDVVRTRIFVTDISQWEAVAKAHREAFADIMPATSMLEVSRLIHADMLIEIEADAIVAHSSP